MNLREQKFRIKVMMGLNESKMENFVQKMIDKSIEEIREESEDWGLGEMDELDEIDSIDKVLLRDFTVGNPTIVSVDLYKNSQRRDFDNTIINLQYYLGKYIPGIKIFLHSVYDIRTFGPSIDF